MMVLGQRNAREQKGRHGWSLLHTKAFTANKSLAQDCGICSIRPLQSILLPPPIYDSRQDANNDHAAGLPSGLQLLFRSTVYTHI